jgi:hypothetical protein
MSVFSGFHVSMYGMADATWSTSSKVCQYLPSDWPTPLGTQEGRYVCPCLSGLPLSRGRATVVSCLVCAAILKPCAAPHHLLWQDVGQGKSFIIRFLEGVLFAA